VYAVTERRSSEDYVQLNTLLPQALDEIEATEALDPLRTGARLLVECGAASPDQLLAMYEAERGRVHDLGRLASTRPKLTTAADVLKPLAPRDADAIAQEASRLGSEEERRRFWGDKLPEEQRPAGFAQHVNWALGDLLSLYPEAFLFGEDVAKKGGVYGVTRELVRRAKRGRVFDTVLDVAPAGIGAGPGTLTIYPTTFMRGYAGAPPLAAQKTPPRALPFSGI
jgi:2-oxoisovalerate dehydrogenase E1 component